LDETGLTGIYTYPDAIPRLRRLYYETLELLKDFPEDSVYKKSVEGLTTFRKSIVDEVEDIQEAEKKIGGGLIEEILIQAGEEYRLAEKMLEWKPWEPLQEQPPEGTWEYFERK
ncbi:ETC complex I subunit conserved region-domain-containing protein, partial [Dipodascopsis uninucleata]